MIETWYLYRWTVQFSHSVTSDLCGSMDCSTSGRQVSAYLRIGLWVSQAILLGLGL